MAGFSGQGKVFVGTALTGAGGVRYPGLLRWVGNASVFKCSQEDDKEERDESFTGSRLPYRTLTRGRNGSLQISFDEFNADNLALALGGAITVVAASGAVVGYTFPSGAKVGDSLMVPAKNISAAALKDSAGTPATLVAGTHYTLDAFAGSFELLSLGSFVQPFKADYTPGAHRKIAALNAPAQDLYVRFDGVNTDDGSRCICDVFRARFSPIGEMDLINEGYQDFALDADLLADTNRATNGAEGQFYAISVPT